jgi:nitrous oxidase accessory protein NosD
MSGDYSRKRFDPEQHYHGVLRQQGRVDLDADWNEYVDLEERRWRAETIDVVGRCGVPAETPDGFKIQISGGELTIGQGRIYVDGFLAENHGAELAFDAALEERYGTAPIPIDEQPYGAGPVTVPEGTRSVVYVDVWRREVTHLQDPDLIEPAVNVDTTTRYQTAWQVKLLSDVAPDVTCETPLPEIPNWPPENLPSAARLTTTTVAVTTEPDPCLVPPSGGYRGLENHLYRVEVHDVSGAGAVRVKWSRENAHVATQVIEILPGRTGLRVESLGRDDVLRFKTGDWVEITSDSREFGRLPGEMRKVTVDDSNQTLTFTAALPAAEFPEGAADAENHVRVIRWDQSGIVRKPDGSELVNLDLTADGLIPLSAGNLSLVLEHGIQVSLDVLAGGSAHSGDYWCFAARTADADIERLDQAPPIGIHHHYCKLAIIEPDGSVDDCRSVFPPLTEIAAGCCTVVVRPGENIQAALDSLPAAGGCVCLKVGQHEIDEPLRIEKSNVTLHGETLGARVVRNNGATLLQVAHPGGLLLENVTVADVQFQFDNKGVQQPALSPLVMIDRCNNGKFSGCIVRTQELGSLAGILISRSADLQVTECQIDGVSLGLWVASDSTRLAILGNTFDAVVSEKSDGGIVGVFFMDAFGASRIEDNSISGFRFGIGLNKGLLTGPPFSGASGSVIAGNRIVRLDTETEAGDDKIFGIDVAANECVVKDNLLAYAAEAYGGIEVSGSQATVENNILHCLARETSANPSIGILVGRLDAQATLVSIGGRVASNSLVGPQDGIVVVGNTGIDVLENRIESSTGEARFGILLTSVDRSRIRGNRMTNVLFSVAANQGVANEIIDNVLLRGGRAVTVLNQTSLEVTQNRIEDMRNWGFIGIQLFAKVALNENRFLSCGYQQSPAISIGVSQHFGELHIESCEVMNTGVSPDNATLSAVSWGIFADLVLEARVQGNIVTFSNAAVMDPNQEHRALWMRGFFEQVINTGAGQFVFGFSAQILDNKFLGPGRSALVETAQQVISDTVLRRFERVFFNNNFCWHVSVAAQPPGATVSLVGRSAIVMGNHIKTNVALPSVDFHNMKDAIYMGNIAQTNPVNFGGVPTPPSGFNKP